VGPAHTRRGHVEPPTLDETGVSPRLGVPDPQGPVALLLYTVECAEVAPRDGTSRLNGALPPATDCDAGLVEDGRDEVVAGAPPAAVSRDSRRLPFGRDKVDPQVARRRCA